MDFKKIIEHAWGIIRLDESYIAKSAQDPSLTFPSVIVVAATGALSAVGVLNPLMLAMIVILPLIVAVLVLLDWIAGRLLGGHGNFAGLFRASALSTVVYWPLALPVINIPVAPLFIFWSLVMQVFISRSVHKISTVRAVIVVLLPALVLVAAITAFIFFGVLSMIAAIVAGSTAVSGSAVPLTV